MQKSVIRRHLQGLRLSPWSCHTSTTTFQYSTLSNGYEVQAVLYRDEPPAHKLRKDLKDTSYLPQSGRPLLSNDPLCLNFKTLTVPKSHFSDPRLEALVQNISTKSPERAWNRFETLYDEDPQILSNLDKSQCLMLLNLVSHTSSSKLPQLSIWERVKTVAEAITNGGHQLGALEYSRLIKSAFKAREYGMVEILWNEVNEAKIGKTTDLWNAYISATCGGDPSIWQIYTLSPHPEPPLINDPVVLFRQLCQEGCMPNTETYELLLLGFAKKGNVDGIRTITSSVWGRLGDDVHESKRYHLARYGSMIQPSLSTLTAIIHSFGANGDLEEGLEYADWLQRKYSINLSTDKALRFWTTALKWTFRNTSPRGSVHKSVFETLWQTLINVYSVRPSAYMLHLRMLYLRSHHRTPLKIFEEMKQIEKQMTHLANPVDVLGQYLFYGGRALISLGQRNKALEVAQEWSNKYEQLKGVREKLEVYAGNSYGTKREKVNKTQQMQRNARKKGNIINGV